MRTTILLLFLAFSHSGVAQLEDFFGKIVTHEIKLTKKDNGTYLGAMEWTTGGIDSLQRFVVNGLDINAPVMVRIITKAPDHNIDVSFHKAGWDKVESKISTNGAKFADKIFRTMNNAGIGVSSEVAGIPYLLIVKVGLQFPSTNQLIRVTDDKEEFTKHLRSIGYMGNVFEDSSPSSSATAGFTGDESNGNNTLMYVIIGLLAAIAILLVVFLVKRKGPKNAALLFLCLCSAHYCLAQKSEPKLVPIPGQADPPVFYDYQSQNVVNQTPISNPRSRVVGVETPVGDGTFITERSVRIDSNPESVELTGAEAEEVRRRMEDANEAFDRDYEENMPGEGTEGDQRILPSELNREEIERLRRQVRELRRQVELLSQEDEDYEPDEGEEAEFVFYCEQLEACYNCLKPSWDKFRTHYVYFTYLQSFYLRKSTDLDAAIKHGDALASIPNAGLGWANIRLYKVRPAMEKLRKAYDKKFDEYVESLEADLNEMRQCFHGENSFYAPSAIYEAQAVAMLNQFKASRISK